MVKIENLHKPTERVIDILNLISSSSKKLNLSNISKILNIPKSTLSPILKTLVEFQFIEQHPESLTYSIGLSSFKVGQKYLENINGLDLIKSHMRAIVKECNEICQLGICHNNEVVYITKVDSEQPVKLMSSIGKSLPLYCTALGRTFLTDYSNDEIKELYKNELYLFTKNTVKTVNDLIKIVETSRIQGFGEEIGEVTSDARCISFPIILNGNIKAAIGISLPIFRATENKINQIKFLLQEHSILISNELTSLNISDII